MIHRRLRFSLERAPGAVDLLDCSKKTLRIEPLVSVEGLEKFLNGVVSSEELASALVLVLGYHRIAIYWLLML